MGPKRRKTLAVATAATVIVAALLLVFATGDDARDPAPRYAAPPAPAGAPNLVVVSVDDQSVSELDGKSMPRTLEFFGDGGTWFDQGVAAPPLCCPSRAGFLTGRYPHNHGVVENTIGYRSMEGAARTFPVALQAAGYRTGMIGKFLNGYEPDEGADPAPGFDRWYAIFGYAGYTDFQVSDDGELEEVGEYATDRLTDEAIDFAAGDTEPFFLWLSYNAPHTVAPGSGPQCDGTDPQPPDADTLERFAGEKLPRPPSFNERDVSDKPSYERGPNRLGKARIAELTQTWRCARASLASVDENLERLIGSLRESGRLENTVVVYVSDNGFYFGEHRIVADKRLPLEPALRVPMAIRVGSEAAQGSGAPPRVDNLVSQVDLAPTLLDYAGIEACAGRTRCTPFDGRSLRPLLESGSGEDDWPRDRGLPLILDEGWTYRALRAESELYIELERTRKAKFDPPAIELYDLEDDPFQLENVARAKRGRAGALAARMNRLLRCAGIEGRDERTQGRPFCE